MLLTDSFGNHKSLCFIGYRHQRSGGAGAGVYSFSGDFAESQKRQQSNSERQARDKEEYEKRRREFGESITCSNLAAVNVFQ